MQQENAHVVVLGGFWKHTVFLRLSLEIDERNISPEKNIEL